MLKHILFDPDDIARAKLGGPVMPGNLVPYIFKILPSDCNELPGYRLLGNPSIFLKVEDIQSKGLTIFQICELVLFVCWLVYD